ncbi:MAG: endonuclease/exonuclease/phosphatase family protein [Armatimonadota bacterium]
MLRVVTYNIRTGLGADHKRSIRRVGDVLAELSPDVVCLQEVDQRMPRSWLANQPKYLGARLGFQAVFQRNVVRGRGAYGNCILAKDLTHCRCHPLPGDGEPRGLLEATVRCDGSEITVFCTHLSIKRDERVKQAREVSRAVRSVTSPKLLAGDMNDVAGSETVAHLLEDPALRDMAQEAGDDDMGTKDEHRIDFILADLHFDLAGYRVADFDASDHRPVLADLALK